MEGHDYWGGAGVQFLYKHAQREVGSCAFSPLMTVFCDFFLQAGTDSPPPTLCSTRAAGRLLAEGCREHRMD